MLKIYLTETEDIGIAKQLFTEYLEFLEKEFQPEFYATDIVNLGKYNIYLKLLVDGVTGRPFSAVTMPPFEGPKESHRDEIIEYSRNKYSSNRKDVEERIAKWTGSFVLKDQKQGSNVMMYDAKCQKCGKWTKVPFKPEPGKRLFCKTCLKELEAQRAERSGRNNNTNDRQDYNQSQNSPQTQNQNQNQSQNQNHEPENRGGEMSLGKLLTKKPVSFSRSRRNNNNANQKKEVNKNELQQALRESQQSENEQSQSCSQSEREVYESGQQSVQRKGKIIPGQTVKF